MTARRAAGALAAAFALAAAQGADLAGAAEGRSMLRCEPAYRTYCANIHISCAGRSRIPAEAFALTFDQDQAEISRAGRTTRLSVSPDRGRRILRPESGEDWIALEPDGRYAERIRRGAKTLMARGRCAPVDRNDD